MESELLCEMDFVRFYISLHVLHFLQENVIQTNKNMHTLNGEWIFNVKYFMGPFSPLFSWYNRVCVFVCCCLFF